MTIAMICDIQDAPYSVDYFSDLYFCIYLSVSMCSYHAQTVTLVSTNTLVHNMNACATGQCGVLNRP